MRDCAGFPVVIMETRRVRLDPASPLRIELIDRVVGWRRYRETIPMRIICAVIALLSRLSACAGQPQAPVEVDLPYSACGSMAPLRSNLTGTPDHSPRSDAALHRLGVRCVGLAAPPIRPRY
jgi:hypothetical protein